MKQTLWAVLFAIGLVVAGMGVGSAFASLTFTGTAVTGDGAVSITAGGSNQNVSVTPSGSGYVVLLGNVGLGTSVPSSTLHVVGTAQFTATSSFSGNLGVGISAPTRPLHIRTTNPPSGGGLLIERTDTGQLQLGITAGGNNPWESPVINFQRHRETLGSPANLADGDDVWTLNGAVRAESVYQGGGGITMEAAGTSNAGSWPTRILFLTQPANDTGNPSERMRITDTGTVGIGTTVPSSTLHVWRSASSTFAVGDSSHTACIAMGDSDGSGISYVTVNNGVLAATTTKPSLCQ